jgi:hypothetical protein
MVKSDSSNSSTDEGNTRPRPKQSSERKCWCFSLNNYTEIETKVMVEYLSSNSTAIVSKEVGEKCGTPHLQGYFELKKKKRFTALKKEPAFKRCHIEPAGGTREHNERYIKGDGIFNGKYKPKSDVIMNTLKNKNVNGKYDEWLSHDKEFMDLRYPKYLKYLLKSDKVIFAEFISWMMCEKKLIPLIFDNNRRIGMVNTLWGFYKENMSAEMFLSKDETHTKMNGERLELYKKDGKFGDIE